MKWVALAGIAVVGFVIYRMLSNSASTSFVGNPTRVRTEPMDPMVKNAGGSFKDNVISAFNESRPTPAFQPSSPGMNTNDTVAAVANALSGLTIKASSPVAETKPPVITKPPMLNPFKAGSSITPFKKAWS